MSTKYLVQSGADNVTSFTTIWQWLASLPSVLTAPETLEIAGDFSYAKDATNAENFPSTITTSAANYLRIYVPPQFRHDGRPRAVSGRGFRLTDGAQFVIGSKHARLEGVELDIAASTALNILSGANSDVRVDGCYIKNNAADTSYTVASTVAGTTATMNNTIVTGSSRSMDTRGSASMTLNNCSIWRDADNLGVVCSGELKAYNTYVGKAAGASADWLNQAAVVGTNNASSDGTATSAFTNSFANIAGASVFKSVALASRDFNLLTGVNALVDAGTSSTGLTTDAIGTVRPQGSAYDIGALERFTATKPSPPTGVTAVVNALSADVSFTPGASNGSATTGFMVTASTGQTATGNASPIHIAGLSDGVDTTFTVTQTNGIGTSDPSAPSNTVRPVMPIPAPAGVYNHVSVDGDTVYVEIDTSNNPTSGTVSMAPSAVSPGGAVAQGPTPLDVSVAGKATAVWYDVPAGSYATPVSTLTNAGGSAGVTGGNGIAIIGVTEGAVPVVPQVTGISVAPANASVAGGGTKQFTATVTGVGGFDPSVVWNTTLGQIDANGLVTVPAAGAVIQNGIVTATSTQDASFSATATVSVPAQVVINPPPAPVVTGITVTPANVVLDGLETQQYTATVLGINNPSQAVNWSVDIGSVDANGLYAAPAATNNIQVATLMATSVQDPTQSVTVTLTVSAAVIDVPPDTPPPEQPEGTTRIKMRFVTPEREVLASAPVEIQASAADFQENVPGIMMPRLLALTTDANGELLVDLVPCDTLYYVTVMDPASDAALFYKFLVPELPMGQVAQLQDIVVDAVLSKTFDEAALLAIVAAKAEAVAAAQQATGLIAALATSDGASMVGYKNGTVADALVSLEAGIGSGGGGVGGGGGTASPGPDTASGNRPEVLLQPDANGVLTPDGNLSNRFRFVLTANVKLGDPINFANNEHIYLTGYQDNAGAHLLTYGLSYMLPSAQPFVPPQGGGAAFLMELRPTFNLRTNVLNWALWGFPDNKTASSGFSLVTKIATIGSTDYFGMRNAMSAVLDGETITVERNGLSAEATGTITGTNPAQVFHIIGRPVVTNAGDQRPKLELLQTDFSTGGANRPSFGKALLNFEGVGTVYVQDVRISGARNDSGDARGLCNNSNAMNLVVRNVEITNCNNGIENGNATMTGNTSLYDVLIDKCGVGSPDIDNSHGTGSSDGYTHSVYFGHNNATITMGRVTLSNSVNGNNLKCRTGNLIATQIRCIGADEGRELEIPNGGVVDIDNSEFIKLATSSNGSLVLVGGNGGPLNATEGLDTTRPRRYRFTNCRFKSDYSISGQYAGRDGYLVCNLDPDVPLEFIDCAFEGELATSNRNDPNGQAIYAGTVTANGIRYKPSAPPIFTYTGGPVGPVKPVGYQPIPMGM